MRLAPNVALEHPVRRRLWKAVFAMTVLLVTLAVGNWVIDDSRALRMRDVGHDFLAFYTAGTFVREGRAANLYDMEAVRDYQFSVARDVGLDLGPGFMPWWNPPFAALPFVPLTSMPYRTALAVWWMISAVAVAGSLFMLVRMLPEHARRDPRMWTLVPAAALLSVPMLLTFSHGQNTAVSLLLLCGVVTLWRANRPVLAGMVCGLLLYKPQLAAVLAIVLIARLGVQALAGLTITGSALLLVTILWTPDAIGGFLSLMPQNLTWFQEANQYYWERHATIKSFWRLLLQGHERGPTSLIALVGWWTCVQALVLLLARTVLDRADLPRLDAPLEERVRRESAHEDRLIAATVASMPLLMPFYFDYDLLLMAVPCVLLAADILSKKTWTALDKWSVSAWGALYAWMMFNVHVGEAWRLNLNVPLLMACSGLMIARAWPAGSAQVETQSQPISRPVSLAA